MADHETALDRLFFTVFYVCIGFLTTFIGLFGRIAFQAPFFIVAALVCLRSVMRPACRRAMLSQLQSKNSVLILLIAIVVLIYALFGIIADSDRTRLLGKPATLLLAVILLAFIWAYRSTFDKERIARGLMLGIAGGLAGVGFISLWNVLATNSGILGAGIKLSAIPISIYSLNDELKILSVLMFFAAAGLKTYARLVPVAIGLVILALSFWTYGMGQAPSGQMKVAHTASDVVQFGLPLVIVAFLLSTWIPRLMIHALFVGVAMLLVLAPWIFQIWFEIAQNMELPRATKFLVRAEIWDKIAQLSLQKPFFGHGLDAVRYFGEIDLAQKYYKENELVHPHNMFIQLWMDMGIVGVSLALALCYASWKRFCAIPVSVQPTLLAGTAMFILFALTTHSLWQTWNLILMCMMFVYFSLQLWDQPGER